MTAEIHDLPGLREQRDVFEDRFDAGDTLASMLKTEYAHIRDALIMAIPAGGVPVGVKLKAALGLPFDLLIVRKLQIPGNPEAGFGAMTLAGTVLLNESLLTGLRLSPEQVETEKQRVGEELERRNALFRKGRPLPTLEHMRVILVDDGLASGFTMLAAIDTVKDAGARETVVAVPTAPRRTIERISSVVDRIYCANIRTATIFAVAEAYRNWYDLSAHEVLDLLEDRPGI
jgi:predicted phosphoribosyltransferase